MATRKVTLSLDAGSLEFAERAAKAGGVSVSSWLSRAARREAVRAGYTPWHGEHAGEGNAEQAQLAAADEAEIMAAEQEFRASR